MLHGIGVFQIEIKDMFCFSFTDFKKFELLNRIYPTEIVKRVTVKLPFAIN